MDQELSVSGFDCINGATDGGWVHIIEGQLFVLDGPEPIARAFISNFKEVAFIKVDLGYLAGMFVALECGKVAISWLSSQHVPDKVFLLVG